MEYAIRGNNGHVHTLVVSDEAQYQTHCGEEFDPLDDDVEVELIVNAEQVSGSACPECGWETGVPETTEE